MEWGSGEFHQVEAKLEKICLLLDSWQNQNFHKDGARDEL